MSQIFPSYLLHDERGKKQRQKVPSLRTKRFSSFYTFFKNSLYLHSHLFCIILTHSISFSLILYHSHLFCFISTYFVCMTIRFRHRTEKKDMKILDSFLFLSLVTFLLIVEAKKKCPDRSSCLDSGKSCRIFKDRVSTE